MSLTLWLAAAALTAGVVALLMRALLRPPPMLGATDGARAIYRDQLAEVDRDRARGVIGPVEAAAARAEIGRRLLAAERGEEGASGTPDRTAPSRRARLLAAVLAALVPVLALAIYVPQGRPDLPAAPFAARDPAAQEAQRSMLAEAQALEARLAAAPDDRAGWMALGEARMALGDPAAAAAAWGRAIGLATAPEPALLSRWAEALVQAGAGVVTEAAIAGFEEALKGDPADPRARFYLALGRAQAGDDAGALAGWQALMRDSPPGAPWVEELSRRIAEAADRLGVEPEILAPGGAPVGDAPPGDEAGAAIAALPPEERAAAIEGMVERLAARLAAEPDDPQGWLWLGQARLVLGEAEAAAEAYGRAAALLPDDPAVLAAWADARLAAGDGDTVPAAFETAMHRLIELQPDSPQALWFLGAAAARDGRQGEAAALWRRLAALFAEGSPEWRALEERIAALDVPADPG